MRRVRRRNIREGTTQLKNTKATQLPPNTKHRHSQNVTRYHFFHYFNFVGYYHNVCEVGELCEVGEVGKVGEVGELCEAGEVVRLLR